MRKIRRNWFCVMLALILLCLGSAAHAEEWACPGCGQTGNTGNFCQNCGAAKPAAQEGWTCISCGHTGNTGNFCQNCGAARVIAPNSGEKEHDGLWKIDGVQDRVEVGLMRIDASSFISNKQDPYRWEPANATDHDESTCWQFSAKKGLKGKSWISLEAVGNEAVDEIWFKNGFWAYNDQGGEQYSINARPKDIRVEIMGIGGKEEISTVDLTLRDECFQGWQRFELGRHENVHTVTIYIQSVYPGSRFKNDVCLSEVMLVQNSPSSIGKDPWWTTSKTPTVYESRQDMRNVTLKMKLATRSGPGTEYDEPGTFFGNNWKTTTVRALGKSWDGSIWWVLVDFSNSGKASYRVWTGLKRLNVNIDQLKEVYAIGQGTVNSTTNTYRGPGGNYARANVSINGWKDVLAYGRENGYVEVEFEQGSKTYRLWVPENETSIDWGTDFSGET